MRRLIFILLLATLFSCEESHRDRLKEYGYTIVVIDKCEYIEVEDGLGDWRVYAITHKGNCKNHKQ